jgi:hypothetical protein
MKTAPPLSTALEFVFVIGLLTGCSTSRPSAWHGSGDPPDHIQLLQIVAGDKSAQLTYRVPLEKGEAASETASDMLKAGLGSDPASVLFAPVFIGVVTGIATARGVPEAERLRAETVLTNAYRRLDLVGELGAELRRVGQQKLPGRWIIGGAMALTGLTNTTASPQMDLWFLVDFLRVGLEPSDHSEVMVNPSLRAVVVIRGSVRTLDGKEIYYNHWEARGRRHPFTHWAEHDGRLLIEDLTDCTRRVAAQAIEEMFKP